MKRLLISLIFLTICASYSVCKSFNPPNNKSSGFFGQSVNAAPDFNGDHIADVIIGSVGEPVEGLPNSGQIYLFDGYTAHLVRRIVSPHPQARGYFGWSIVGLTDMNGDGSGDVLVGAHGENPGNSPFMAGRVYVFSGATGNLLLEMASPNAQYSGNFGWSVAAGPDVDNDGIAEIIVGAKNENSSLAPEGSGRAYVFSGASGRPLLTLSSPAPAISGAFGHAVAGLDRVTSGGLNAIAVAAIGESTSTLSAAGKVHVFEGAQGGLLFTLSSPAPAANGCFGQSLCSLGDVDDDGFDDLAVGAPGEDSGKVYVFSGADGSLLYSLQSPHPQSDGLFGWSVAQVKDMTGDGVNDLIVGACGEDTTVTLKHSGRIYLFDGSNGALVQTYVSPHPQAQGALGYAVAGAGDLDNDIWGDVLGGAPGEAVTSGGARCGVAYSFTRDLPQTRPEILVAPVIDQTSSGLARYGDSDYGAGVCFAVGYYYRTAQAAASQRWTLADLQDPGKTRSPYFLLQNGGGRYFHFAFELLESAGVCSLAQFTTQSQTTTAALAQAAEFKALDYRPFFVHHGGVNGLKRFIGVFDNDIAALKRHLRARADGFVIGIPVFASFEDYRSDVYNVTAGQETLRGFHALFVMGYDDTRHAFRIANSWGTDWGEKGLGWLGYDFVRKYALEAWWMKSEQGFAPNQRVATVGRRQFASSRDYSIIYTTRIKDGGIMSWDGDGLQIIDGAMDDTLLILRKPGVTIGETIPAIVSDGGFRVCYTEAPIGELNLGGPLKRLTARNCHVGQIYAVDARVIRMSAQPNSTWQWLSYYLAQNPCDHYTSNQAWLNRYATTSIEDSFMPDISGETPVDYSNRHQTQVSLAGVRCGGVTCYWRLDLRLSSRRIQRPGVPVYYGYGGVAEKAQIEPDAGADLQIRVAGGSVDSASIAAGAIRRIVASSMPVVSVLTGANNKKKRFSGYFAGNVRADSIYSAGRLRSIEARGGDLQFVSIVSDRDIGPLSAICRKYFNAQSGRYDYAGGWFGDCNAPTSCAVEATGYFWSDRVGTPNIDAIYGSFGVAAAFNAADGAGLVKSITTLHSWQTPSKAAPLILGESWSKKRIRFSGGNASNFVEH
ncbi:MAG: hypothetical protein NTX50_06175 [Candidatus Sumerlaeota bacterium]|nr:hypothetical protein [Candidatus Sumerlaeota bacterium]